MMDEKIIDLLVAGKNSRDIAKELNMPSKHVRDAIGRLIRQKRLSWNGEYGKKMRYYRKDVQNHD